jgi:hypothetical protein
MSRASASPGRSGIVRARTTGSNFSARRAATEDMNLRRSALALRFHSAV